jgi:hypothetical protein
VGLRFNPPPDWPEVPDGFAPPPGWQPDPAWPPVPAGWSLWVPEDGPPARPASAPFPGPDDDPPTDPLLGGQLPYSQLSWSDLLSRRGSFRDSYRGRAPAGPATRLARAALVLGLLSFTLLTGILSVIFALIALARIRDDPQPGRGLAVAGIVLSGVWGLAIAVAIAVVIAIGSAAAPQRPPAAGRTARAQPVAVWSLRAGECFRNPGGSAAAAGVVQVTPVPCGQRHGGQVIAVFPVTGRQYPAAASLPRQARLSCQAAVAGNVNTALVTATMTARYLYPGPASWAAGARAITCLMVDSAGDMTSSLLVQPVAGLLTADRGLAGQAGPGRKGNRGVVRRYRRGARSPRSGRARRRPRESRRRWRRAGRPCARCCA